MKEYFIKYLPVPGEIIEGDKVLYKKKHICEVRNSQQGKGLLIIAPKYSYPYLKNEPKVTPFVCSKNIQIGDDLTLFDLNDSKIIVIYKLITVYEGSEGIESGFIGKVIFSNYEYVSIGSEGIIENSTLNKSYFKVIGPLSSNAYWAKEGSEFDENQIAHKYYIDNDGNFIYVAPKDYLERYKDDYKDKLPRWYGKDEICIKASCGYFH